MDTYCIVRALPNGSYQCVDKIRSLEETQIKMLLLEADHPGDYLAFNQTTGKCVQRMLWAAYVC